MTKSEAIKFIEAACRAAGSDWEQAREAVIALGVHPDELHVAGFEPST